MVQNCGLVISMNIIICTYIYNHEKGVSVCTVCRM